LHQIKLDLSIQFAVPLITIYLANLTYRQYNGFNAYETLAVVQVVLEEDDKDCFVPGCDGFAR
jgi:hypothetical protein